MVEILGYVIGFLVGIIMGLIGGGGALLLPVFIYLLNINDNLATAYTLLLVGVTAVFGAIPRVRKKQVDCDAVLLLGIPILLATLIVRYIYPNVPQNLFAVGGVVIKRQMVVLVIFSSVLVLSFASMMGLIGRNLKPRPNLKQESPRQYYTTMIVGGTLIGVISAMIGAGGGVMIVPLLVVLLGKDMKVVVGTSLTIMALKSPISFFLADAVMLWDQIKWPFLAKFLSVMVSGVCLGTLFSKRVESEKLKKLFAWFILAMAIYIFSRELIPG